ncbi:FKBP-type peptidyl-prolyl cis-trans isomerase [Sulfurimonas sp. MAG313]|nr:FKBP-type peptidyl-prolyl cis-trans isomerase [Sulfurimonas sp. MAG313]MDF1881801.1 FKBP-type peptidyl-prolyl cis-trans isomerase [Sulfurimonas sp. MAG313]
MSNTKKYISVALSALVILGLSACNDEKALNKEMKTLTSFEDKAGYSIGVQVGKQLSPTKNTINIEALMMGVKDTLEGQKLQLSDEQMTTTMQEFKTKMQEDMAKKRKASLEINAKEGTAFLKKNKEKEGVVSLNSGLQYKIIKVGTGKTPKATDTVETNYKGTLINGTEFDSSYKRGQTASFPVNGVIKGWTEALQLMKEGSKWELYIPSSLAYGEQGAGQLIAPNSTLVFEIELIKVK